MRGCRGEGVTRFLESLALHDSNRAAQILDGVSRDRRRRRRAVLSLLATGGSAPPRRRGLQRHRLARPDGARSVITCEAGPGHVLLPPTEEEVLFGLVDSRLIAIPQEQLELLLLVVYVGVVIAAG